VSVDQRFVFSCPLFSISGNERGAAFVLGLGIGGMFCEFCLCGIGGGPTDFGGGVS